MPFPTNQLQKDILKETGNFNTVWESKVVKKLLKTFAGSDNSTIVT